MLKPRLMLMLPLVTCVLAGCEQLGLETPAQTTAKQEAEGRAIGSACRHAGKALEDCYGTTPKASKAAIFNGWKEMDAYMRDNKLDVVTPKGVPKPAPKKKAEDEEEEVAPEKGGNKNSKDKDPAASEKSSDKSETPKAEPADKAAKHT